MLCDQIGELLMAFVLITVLCYIFDGILYHVLLILNDSQKEMSITFRHMKYLNQLAHKKLVTTHLLFI